MKLTTHIIGRLAVHPHDSPLRWRVQSNSRPEIEHVVDLGDYAGNGSCSCEHFQIRLRVRLKTTKPGTKATRCGHILAARNAFANNLIQILVEKENGQE